MFRKKVFQNGSITKESIEMKSLLYNTEKQAQFLVPDWGMKPAVASGCRTGSPAYVAWRAGTTVRRHAGFIPQSGTRNTATGFLEIIITGSLLD